MVEAVVAPKRSRIRSLIASIATGAVVAGSLVAVGIGAQQAAAAEWAPEVSVASTGAGEKNFILAGEDAAFTVEISNADGGKQFNLGVSALLPESVSFVDGAGSQKPTKVYGPLEVLPNASRTGAATAESCAASGLIPASTLDPAGPANRCAVPAGQQMWVWANIDDLPQGGTVALNVKVRPDAGAYPVGSTINFNATAYTSTDPSRLPTFDGSESKAKTTDHTSNPGLDRDFSQPDVRALRVTKSEPSPERELLRGVHDHPTVYTIKVENTGQAATEGVTVTDYLPAGLEYLGIAGGDNSAAGSGEYSVDGQPRRIPGQSPLASPAAERVETVQLSAAEATALGLAGAGVYTKVTWALSDLTGGTAQSFPDAPATSGSIELKYYAAVPLFENAMWTGDAPDPATGVQGANLDNNTGPSTRHGSEDAANPANAKALTNAAVASGAFTGPVFNDDEGLRTTSDADTETVEAVDLHVIKSVEEDAFTTGALADYALQVRASEYVDAQDVRLTDVIPNGLCPAFPAQSQQPQLTIKTGDAVQTYSDAAEWSEDVVPSSACDYPNAETGATVDNATVESIEFNEDSGQFTVVFAIDALAANGTADVRYTLMQRPNYTGAQGSTSSGDRLTNRVSITGTTSPIADIAADPALLERVGDERYPLDDSQATISSHFTGIEKEVLERGRSLEQSVSDPAAWQKQASMPFSPGDHVWYRIQVPFTEGIDTRNPVLDDYLPPGVDFVQAKYAYTGVLGAADATTPKDRTDSGFPQAYIPAPSVDGPHISWDLGEQRGDFRFMPLDSSLTVYLEGVVTAQSASADDVDNPANHAKYQQVNVDGELTFRRSDATIDLDWGATLQKGIKTNTYANGSSNRAFGEGGTDETVAQGDSVTYRIDVTTPQNTTNGYVIWDVLPEGVTAADVAGGSFTADLYDSGAAGSPETALDPSDFTATAVDTVPSDGPQLSTEYADRSVVIWNISSDVPGSEAATETSAAVTRGLTLGYTLNVPDGSGGAAAQLTQSYENTAGIVSYDIPHPGSSAAATTVVPQQQDGGQLLTTRTPDTDEVGFGDADTYDSAEVHLPDAAVEKTLVSTQVSPSTADVSDPNNGAGAIVQGEYATFEYAVTIPANTTVTGASLTDRGTLTSGGDSVSTTVVAGSGQFFGPGNTGTTADSCGTGGALAGFICDTDTGALTFPATYTNDGAEPEKFRVQLTMWVGGGAQPGDLLNAATFTFDNPASGAPIEHTAEEAVALVEPKLAVTKSASQTVGVNVDQPVTFTIVVSNGASAPKSYDNVVIDELPPGLRVDRDSFTVNGATAPSTSVAAAPGAVDGTGGTIVWDAADISELREIPGAVTLTYRAQLDPQAGAGEAYTNTVKVQGHTLPAAIDVDYERGGPLTASSEATVTADTAGITKQVRVKGSGSAFAPTASAPVGATAEYEVRVALKPFVNYYDVRIDDIGLNTSQAISNATVTLEAEGAADEDVTADWSVSTAGSDTRTWAYAANGGTIASSNEARVIVLRYEALITKDLVTNAQIGNTANFKWKSSTAQNAVFQTLESDADVNILRPQLTVAKGVKRAGATGAYASSANGNVDQRFTYEVRVANGTGVNRSDAFNAEITDKVPAGIVVDESSFKIGGVAAPAGAVTKTDNTITWSIPGPVAPGATVALTYEATFAPSATLTSDAKHNTAGIRGYDSYPTNGERFTSTQTAQATVTPLLPDVTLKKAAAVASKTAYAGEPFEWVLTATNTASAGAAQKVVLTDTLPANWTFTETKSITVAGATVAATPPSGGASGPLVWTFGADAVDATSPVVLQPGQSITVRYTATPSNPDAITAPGVGGSNPHTNTLSAVTTDRRNATGSASGSYTDANATDSAFLRDANLVVSKQPIGGVTNSGAQPTNLYGLATGTWVPGQPTVANRYAQPQWQVTVKNQGPDASFGPFVFTDTTVQPTGVSTGAFSARYYATASDVTGTPLALTVRADGTMSVGLSTTRLWADGSDRIVLTANVTSNDAATAAAAQLTNTANVIGRTFEAENRMGDNTSTAQQVLTPIADLAIQKVVNTATPVVGSPISWGITARNLGPSVSVASDDAPITITDTVPAGVTGVTASSNTDWVATLADGSAIPEDGVDAGTEIVWTYQGASMAVGATAQVTLSGTILTSQTGELLNSATVTPGATAEPANGTANNTAEVGVTPDDSTALGVTKTRVVNDEGTWRPATAAEPFVPGTPVSYRVDVANNGPADARAVSVVDTRPAGLSYASHVGLDATAWSDTHTATTDTFTLQSAQAPQTTRSFVVTYTSAPSVLNTISNTVVASADNATNEPEATDSTGSSRRADVSIEKSHTAPAVGAAAQAGASVTYQLVVTNEGPSDSDAPIAVTDTLPDGFAYRAGSATVAVNGAAAAALEPTSADNVLTWADVTAGADLPLGATSVITFIANVDADLAPQTAVLNSADVSAPNDTDPGNNHAEDLVDIERSASMTVEKTADSATFVAGGEATYTLQVTNAGPSAAPAQIADALPAGLTLVEISGTGWDCDASVAGAQSATCEYAENDGLLPVGTSTLQVTAAIAPTVTAGTELENTATLTWSDSAGTRTDDDEATITVVTAADLGIVKDVIDAPEGDVVADGGVLAGESVWYRLQVRNFGPSDAVGPIVVTDTLPLGVTVAESLTAVGPWAVSATAADGETPQVVTFTLASGLLADTASDEDRGVAPVIEFEAQFAPTLGAGTLANTASVESETPEPAVDPHPNEDSADVAVSRSAEVGIEKGHVAADPDEFVIGDTVTFTFDASNSGPSSSNTLTVTDTFPAGLSYVEGSIAGDAWSVTRATVNDDGTTTVVANYAGTVLPGASAPQLRLSALVTVGIGTQTSVTNEACAASPEETSPVALAAACDDESITVVPLADLEVTKSLDESATPVASITAGEPITWTIAPRNVGPSISVSTESAPITVTDTLPAGIANVEDPSTELWSATVERDGESVEFPARAGDTITWTFTGEEYPVGSGEDFDGSAYDISLTGVIEAAWTSGAIENVAEVVPGATRDPRESNNESAVSATPGDATSLRIAKTRVVLVDGEWVVAAEQDPIPTFLPGDDVSYRVTVVNDGPADAREVSVVDEVPMGLSYDSHESEGAAQWARTAGGTTASGQSDDWDTFALAGTQQAGAASARSFVVTYGTDPAMPNGESFVNTVDVTAVNWKTAGGESASASDTEGVASTRSADLEIEKSHTAPAGDAAAIPGETAEYRLLVTNHGPSISDAPIAVTDELPSGFTYVAESAAVSVAGDEATALEPTVAGNALTWADATSGATLAPDATVVVTFTVSIDADLVPAEGVENVALVDGPNDNNPLNDRDTDLIDVVGSADLALSKRVVTTSEDITAGSAVTWSIEPRNLGPSTARSTEAQPITITDTIPEGVTALAEDPSSDLWRASFSNAGGWNSATAGDTITWTYTGASILVGGEPSISVTGVIDPAWTGGEIVNTAAVHPGATSDPEPENNSDGVSISPDDRTNLTLWKTRVVQSEGVWVPATSLEPVPQVVPGTDVSYRVTVRNDGPADARDVSVVDQVPAGLTFVAFASESGEWNRSAGALDADGAANEGWDTFALSGTQQVGPEQLRSFIVTYGTDPALDVSEPLVNVAEASATNSMNRPPASDSSAEQASADLSIVKTSEQDRVNAGGTVGYRLLVTNEGPSIARGPITVTDALPIGMTYAPGTAQVVQLGAVAEAGEPVVASVSGAQQLTWTPIAEGASLAVGDTVEITLEAVVADSVVSADGLTNVASVTAADDENPVNNASNAAVLVDPVATLTTEKTAVGDFQVGQIGEYRIAIENQGPTLDPGPITVTDALPDGLRFASSPDDGAQVSGSTVTWTLPQGLAVGERAEFTLFVHVDQAAYPSVTNTVTVETPTTQTDGAQLTSSATAVVSAADGLPTTGADAAAFAALAALLLLLGGAGALLLARRRREATAAAAAG
ncbi:isopeptide-forming domain-containing fimbrial protein [Leucobacter sp. NPDC077196]|uniref:isopeptide-forming domain-containing fimbrial protein n=1 Tax=Leucobacter sp. NPDC077196 TaxID=3154959 RepID=UPI003442AE7B